MEYFALLFFKYFFKITWFADYSCAINSNCVLIFIHMEVAAGYGESFPKQLITY